MLFQPLLNALRHGEVVITPTNRLQRELLWHYASYYQQTTYIKPLCFSYESFLQHWFDEQLFQKPLSSPPICLSNWQFYLLWKKIAQKHTSRSLNHFEIKQAISAYKNCALAQSPPHGSDFLYTPIAEQFQKIVEDLEYTLEENQWIAPAKLANYLMHTNYPFQHQKITWAFFDCFHPQQDALMAHLSNHGIEHHLFDFPHQHSLSSSHQIYVASDAEMEMQQLIQWIKIQQQHGCQRIGVVVPDLSRQANALKRLLKRHFNPTDLHFSLGESLWNFPIVKHALLLLKLNPDEALSKEQCKVLLLSPFISSEGPRQNLLQHPIFQEPFIPFDIFLEKTKTLIPQLSLLKTFPKEASASEWISYFEKRLTDFSFPGSIPLNENNQKVLSTFYLLIEALQSMALIMPKISASDALDFLEKSAQDAIHQPPQNYHGIHFMGWLESSGFCGDALWICHFQSHLVPQPIQFSPLLPIHWQKKNQLARTQSHQELEMAKRMLQRFINAHPEAPVVISCAKTKNEEPLWPSPLLPVWSVYCPKDIHPEAVIIENIVQNYAIPLQDKSHLPKGGYQVLASLANCPFQAFANYRLHSKSLLQEEVGLNASERGRMLHRALQHIWEELKDQNKLKQLNEDDTQAICLRAIDKTLAEFKDRPFSLDELMIKLERQQLLELIHPYLERDKKREYFKIEGLEKTIALTIDDWTFELRYDRLDKLANGDLVMIDYKSKIPSPLPWEDERPIHPQILMYALALASIRYLLFVAINPKELKSSGLGMDKLEPYTLKTSKEPWETWQHKWYAVLKTLIEEFKSGNCAPTPLSAKTCRYCHNRDICRQESQAVNEED